MVAVSSFTCRRLHPEVVEKSVQIREMYEEDVVHGIGLVLEIIGGVPYTWHTWCGLRMRNPKRSGSNAVLFPAKVTCETVNCLECLAEHDPALDEHFRYPED